MSFWLYQKIENRYQKIAPVKMTGAQGVLARFLQAHAGEDIPFKWCLSGSEIIRWIEGEPEGEDRLIVVDLMPEVFHQACLYRLNTIQGVSEDDQSDIVLAFQALYQGSLSVDSAQFKKCFQANMQDNDRQMLEAMQLTGGTRTGRYFLASPKMNIGAAVCPSSMAPVMSN